MLQCVKFILDTIREFIAMLFTINTNDGLNLGLILCLAFIFLPMMLRIINFIKQDAIEEIDDAIDERRPRETWSFTERQYLNTSTGKGYKAVMSHHTKSRSRRYRLK